MGSSFVFCLIGCDGLYLSYTQNNKMDTHHNIIKIILSKVLVNFIESAGKATQNLFTDEFGRLLVRLWFLE